ncbi:MAG: hypothetical protein SGI97_03945 [candidate division Zixibacteria bacterium]|nr:hypothetical protein [candidate division Zixibacteria bacterium]
MKISKSTFWSFIIAAVSFGYPIADYSGIMDWLRGRQGALEIWERLSLVQSGDSVIVFNDEPCFGKGIEFLITNSQNAEIRKYKDEGIVFSAIARVGGVARPPGTENMTDLQDKITRFYASPSSPLILGFDYTRKDRDSGKGLPLGSLGEIIEWVNESRESERFVVYTLLVGALSLIVAFKELRKST